MINSRVFPRAATLHEMSYMRTNREWRQEREISTHCGVWDPTHNRKIADCGTPATGRQCLAAAHHAACARSRMRRGWADVEIPPC